MRSLSLAPRILIAMIVLGTALFLAVAFSAKAYRFHPMNRVDLVNPAGAPHRAFEHHCGFSDPTILVKASDWPWTFGGPVTLGDAEWPEYSSFVWSRDGSVLASSNRESAGNGEFRTVFRKAYDFREHRTLNSSAEIRTLIEDRGGSHPNAPTPCGKGDLPATDFPYWTILPPLLLISGGFLTASRLLFPRKGGKPISSTGSRTSPATIFRSP